MNTRALFLMFLLGIALARAGAVETIVNGSSSYNTNAPTDSDIANWDTGWGGSGVTGWDYIGRINGAGGVYIGNDWVLTAGHVGAGTFTLDGTSYNAVPGSAEGFVSSSGSTADLTLFQLAQGPDLPPLILATTTPSRLSHSHPGNQVVMIGYGGTFAWGVNTVTSVNVGVIPEGYNYETTDFETAYGTTTDGTNTATNDSVLIPGDSGGGDFIYDSSTGTWLLAGINEAVDNSNDSYMIQVSAYAPQIQGVMAVPEPGGFLLAGVALAMMYGLRRKM